MARLWAFLIIALLVCGCGGGGGDDQPVARTDPGNIVPAPANPAQPAQPAQQKTFTIPNFGTNQQAILVSGFQPPTQQPAQTASYTVNSNNRGLPTTARQGEAPTQDPLVSVCAAPLFHQAEPPAPTAREILGRGVVSRFETLAEGSQQSFFVATTGQRVTAQKVLEPNETIHCTIFAQVVNNTPILSRARALEFARAFDNNNPFRPGDGIYNQVRAVFGSEWNQNPPGGRDGDTKVVFLFLNAQGIGNNGFFGFFNPSDSLSLAQNANSNEAEILYFNANKTTDELIGTIAHEFQHMINYNQKVIRQGQFPAGAQSENLSVNEGLSVLAEDIAGYTLNSGNGFQFSVVRSYLNAPQNFSFFRFTNFEYGQGYLFFRYVFEQFGSQTITSISTSTEVGLTNLNANLVPGFQEVFRRWTIANHATNLTGANLPNEFRYPSGFQTNGTFPGLGTLPGPAFLTAPTNGNFTTPTQDPWSAAYLRYAGGNGTALTLQFTQPADVTTSLLHESPTGSFSSAQQ